MVECWVQKEALVVQLEVLVGLTDAALAESQKLLSFGKGPHGDGPFFKSNRHVVIRGNGGLNKTAVPHGPRSGTAAREWSIVRERSQIAKCPTQIGGMSASRGKPHYAGIPRVRPSASPYPEGSGPKPASANLCELRTVGGRLMSL